MVMPRTTATRKSGRKHTSGEYKVEELPQLDRTGRAAVAPHPLTIAHHSIVPAAPPPNPHTTCISIPAIQHPLITNDAQRTDRTGRNGIG
jgi:hypothetical protein